MVVVRVFDLSGRIPLGFLKVTAQVAELAQELARSKGRNQVSLQDLDSAQVQIEDSLHRSKMNHPSNQLQVQESVWYQAQESSQESALPKGYRLDSEQGLVRDWTVEQVRELG